MRTLLMLLLIFVFSACAATPIAPEENPQREITLTLEKILLEVPTGTSRQILAGKDLLTCKKRMRLGYYSAVLAQSVPQTVYLGLVGSVGKNGDFSFKEMVVIFKIVKQAYNGAWQNPVGYSAAIFESCAKKHGVIATSLINNGNVLGDGNGY